MGPAAHQPPYKSPPKAPVLSLKPRNTLAAAGADIVIPSSAERLVVGATLALVIGRTACRVSVDDALDHLAGYTIAADLSMPHDSHYRPAVRLRARDGFCPIGPRVVVRGAIADPDRLAIRVWVDERLVHTTSTAGMLRPAARLLAEVSDFMTLVPGDVLLLGMAPGAPQVAAGQGVAIEIEGLGRLHNRFVAEVTVSAE